MLPISASEDVAVCKTANQLGHQVETARHEVRYRMEAAKQAEVPSVIPVKCFMLSSCCMSAMCFRW